MSSGITRRSLRLARSGYYKEDGTPCFSYKERMFQVFKKRPVYIDEDDSMSSYSSNSSNRSCGSYSYRSGEGGNSYFGEYVQDFLRNQRNVSDCREDRNSDPLPLLVQDNGTQTTWTGARNVVLVTQSTQTSPVKEGTSFHFLSLQISFFFLMLLLIFGFTHMYVNFRVQQEFKTFQPRDNTPLWSTMPNFALESQGARVLHDLSSHTYWPDSYRSSFIWDKLTYWWYSQKKQRAVIQGLPSLIPGECWPLEGEQGHLFIKLSHPVHITHVTLGHIMKRQDPSRSILSAPREFSVSGFSSTEEEGAFLGRHVYNPDGADYQTFVMPNPDKGVFSYVKLQIENNWGNKDCTCVYKFKVHGNLHSQIST